MDSLSKDLEMVDLDKSYKWSLILGANSLKETVVRGKARKV